MRWTIERMEEWKDPQPIIVDVSKRILRYNPKFFMVRIMGTEKDPQLYIYSLK